MQKRAKTGEIPSVEIAAPVLMKILQEYGQYMKEQYDQKLKDLS